MGHAGWINAAKMIVARQDVPRIADDWPPSVAYGQRSTLTVSAI